MSSSLKIQLIVDRVSDPSDFHVYLHPTKMSSLNISDGMIVRIISRTRRTILASACSGKRSMPVSTIQMGRCLRLNLSAYLGQIVVVDAFPKCVVAESVTVSPIDDTVEGLTGDFQQLFNANLVSLPMTPNFIIPVFTMQRVIEFKVMSVTPSNFVIVRNPNSIIVKNATVPRGKDIMRFDSVSYDDFFGIEPQLRDLRADIELPLLQPNIFETFGIHPFRGVLISAPSGSGKSQLARAIQNESPLHFERIPGFDLLARPADKAAYIMRKLADRAIAKAPSIVFVDELDLIIQDQYVNGQVDKRLYLAFIAIMDMLIARQNIVVIGTTRDVANIPTALKNVNRFGHIIEIQAPGRDKKIEMLQKMSRGINIEQETLEKYADQCKNGGDLEAKIFEEILNKGLEIASNHTIDDEPIQISELLGQSLADNAISSRNQSNDNFSDLDPHLLSMSPARSPAAPKNPFARGSLSNSSSKDFPHTNKNPFAQTKGDMFNHNSGDVFDSPSIDPFAKISSNRGSSGLSNNIFDSPEPSQTKKSPPKKAPKIDPFAPRQKK